MIEKRTILEILARAANAPSGDNSQPWRFRVLDDGVEVYNLPQADPTLYNFRERGSYFAHGALVENITVAAACAGYRAAVDPFPGALDCTARITLAPAAPDTGLCAALDARTTNRKPYSEKKLEQQTRTALQSAMQGDATLTLVEGAHVSTLAQAVSTNERLLMENREMHDFLFGIIRWSAAQERQRPGLYVRTMEFPAPVRLMMRFVLRHWFAVRLLNHVGLSRAIPKQSAAGYAASAAMGAVVIAGERDVDFFHAGRAFERLWLIATSLDLSIQPVTALPYLMQRVEARQTASFSKAHIELIRQAYETIAAAVGLPAGSRIAMLFRIGYAQAPSAHSIKQTPVLMP